MLVGANVFVGVRGRGGGGGVAGINRLLLEPAVRNSYASFNLANVFG